MKIVTIKLLKNIKYNFEFLNNVSKNIPIFLCLFILGFNTTFIGQSFKNSQLANQKVASIYNKRIENIESILESKGINLDQLEVLLLGTKFEKKLNLYAKNKDDQEFILLKKYDFCKSSGHLGPKRKEWDGQIPEGIYYINHFFGIIGRSETIPLMVSIWIPLLILLIISTVGLVRINEK